MRGQGRVSEVWRGSEWEGEKGGWCEKGGGEHIG